MTEDFIHMIYSKVIECSAKERNEIYEITYAKLLVSLDPGCQEKCQSKRLPPIDFEIKL